MEELGHVCISIFTYLCMLKNFSILLLQYLSQHLKFSVSSIINELYGLNDLQMYYFLHRASIFLRNSLQHRITEMKSCVSFLHHHGL